jgi:uncharacterized protein
MRVATGRALWFQQGLVAYYLPMEPGRKRSLPRGAPAWILLAAAFAALIILMPNHSLERMFVYFPDRRLEADPAQLGLRFEDVWLRTSDGVRIHGWHVPFDGSPRTILIFHGNAGNISHRLGWIEQLRGTRSNIFIIDYRGYGRSEGEPFEDGLYRDARAAWEWWNARRKEGDGLVLLGESLGGAVAVNLAARVPCDGLVLQSTFSSGKDLARRLFPLGLLRPLAGVRFDSAAEIRSVRCPKLVIHGDRDSIVPIDLGRSLYGAAPEPKLFVTVPGADHNDLVAVGGRDYLRAIGDFLEGLPRAGAPSQEPPGR